MPNENLSIPAGCDPNNMDFRNVPAAKNFEEEHVCFNFFLSLNLVL